MNDKNSRTERQVLLMSAVGNLVIGMVGLFFCVLQPPQGHFAGRIV